MRAKSLEFLIKLYFLIYILSENSNTAVLCSSFITFHSFKSNNKGEKPINKSWCIVQRKEIRAEKYNFGLDFR